MTGSRQYEVHRTAKRALVTIIVIVPVLVFGLLGAICRLNQSVHQLEFRNEDMINAMTGKRPFSFAEDGNLGKKTSAVFRDIFGQIDTIEKTMSIEPPVRMNLAERMGQAAELIKHRQNEYGYIEDRIGRVEQMMGLRSPVGLSPRLRVDAVSLATLYKRTMLDSIPNGYPVEYKGITGRYGLRTHPILKREEYHRGVDLTANLNSTIEAVADGVVEFAGFHKKSGLGNLVILHHNYAFRTLYGHLSKATVRAGDFIRRGDQIGLTGNSGLSDGPHLHYEIWHNGKSLNPEPFMTWGMESFETIFSVEKGVEWQSLQILIEQRLAMQAQLSLQPALG